MLIYMKCAITLLIAVKPFLKLEQIMNSINKNNTTNKCHCLYHVASIQTGNLTLLNGTLSGGTGQWGALIFYTTHQGTVMTVNSDNLTCVAKLFSK